MDRKVLLKRYQMVKAYDEAELLEELQDIREFIGAAASICYNFSLSRGWYHSHVDENGNLRHFHKKNPYNKAEKLCLIHSEVSEIMESVRVPGQSEKIPEYTKEEEEAADVLMRMLDYCGRNNLRIGDAFLHKFIYNTKRPDHDIENRVAKGGKKF